MAPGDRPVAPRRAGQRQVGLQPLAQLVGQVAQIHGRVGAHDADEDLDLGPVETRGDVRRQLRGEHACQVGRAAVLPAIGREVDHRLEGATPCAAQGTHRHGALVVRQGHPGGGERRGGGDRAETCGGPVGAVGGFAHQRHGQPVHDARELLQPAQVDPEVELGGPGVARGGLEACRDHPAPPGVVGLVHAHGVPARGDRGLRVPPAATARQSRKPEKGGQGGGQRVVGRRSHQSTSTSRSWGKAPTRSAGSVRCSRR